MRKIIYLFILSTTFILSSCSKDDDGGTAAEDTIVVDGTTIDISSALIEDYRAGTGYIIMTLL